MAERLKVNPTRGNLLKLKEDLQGIRSRHDLLDRKRELLVQELLQRLEKAKELERQFGELLKAAHEAIQIARLRMGSERIEWISLSPAVRFDLDITVETFMGLKIPRVAIEVKPLNPPYGLSDSSVTLDEACRKWTDVLEFLADASETLTSVWRLGMELRKTRRLVNALEYTIIPRYENTIDYIDGRLEEEEREEITRTRKIKEQILDRG